MAAGDFATGSAGSVGSLMGAAMETAGYHVQSELLDVFNGPLGMKLGGLLYLIAIITALITLASGGSYRYGLWLLIGPPLFFFLIGTRSEVPPADWQFGDRLNPAERVEEAARGVGGESQEERNVAYFFKAWNKLTSEVVQELIRVLNLTENASDLSFLQKADLYYTFWTQVTLDPTLKGFIHFALINRCAPYFYALKTVNDPDIPEPRKIGLQRVLQEHADGTTNISVNMADHEWFKEWLNTVFNGTRQIKDNYTCKEIWDLAIEGFKVVHGSGYLEILLKQNLPDGMSAGQRRDILMLKFDQHVQHGASMQTSGNDDAAALSMLINELAARVLSKEFFHSSKALIGGEIDQFPELMSSQKDGGLKFSQETNRAIRTIHGGDEYIHRGELIGAALTLPYIQGLVLFFLAAVFPFFAIMVVVPGRENGILIWMSLWLWVKLWDFGFAVVKMIDNMLYALLPHGQALTSTEIADPGTTFRILFEVDPTYSAHTYYNIMATCMFAIPIITGLFVIGAGSELVGAVSQGWKDYPTQIGQSMGTFNRALYNNENAAKVHRYTMQQLRSQAWSAVVNDPVVMNNLMTSLENRLGGEASRQVINDLKANVGDNQGLQDVLNKWDRDGAITGSAGALTNAIASAYSTQAGQRALAKLNLNLQTIAFEASRSDYARSLAGFAVMMRYNSHDFGRNASTIGAASLNWETAKRQNIVVGKTSDAAVNAFIDFFRAGR